MLCVNRARSEKDAAWLATWLPLHKNIPEQWAVVEYVMEAINKNVPAHIFIDGPAGTGKGAEGIYLTVIPETADHEALKAWKNCFILGSKF